MPLGRTYGGRDPAEAVALVAASRRTLLLRVHRRRLRWEDLEDAYSQATLELVARSRRAPFQSNAHIANALEQKFLSRIDDRRRAISGRSAIESALAGAVPVDEPDSGVGELEDRGAEVLHRVARRLELQRLREVVADLTEDQRLVLASQVGHEMECGAFCERYGWSPEKYRKVAQRARARLRVLVDSHQSGERCRMLESDLNAYAAGVLDPERAARVLRHLENCRACMRQLQDLDRASRKVAALLLPALASPRLLAKLTASSSVGAGTVTAGAGGGAFGAGGSLLGAGVAKLGVAAACVAGGVAICSHAGLIGGHSAPTPHRTAAIARRAPSVRGGEAPVAARPIAGIPSPPRGAHVPRDALTPRSEFGSGGAAEAQARREFSSHAAHASAVVGFPERGVATSPSRRPPPGEFGFER